MYKRLCDYIDYIEEASSAENMEKISDEQKKQLAERLLVQIQFFQHERLMKFALFTRPDSSTRPCMSSTA